MRAMQAKGFNGYSDLQLVDIPQPTGAEGKVLVRVTAAGVTPLDHTILTGNFPMAKAPLVPGNEGAGVVVSGGGDQFPSGARVMFTGPYGVFQNGSYSEWIEVEKDHLWLTPDNVEDSAAAGIPVAYLTAYIALKLAGFESGKSVLGPAIGGSVGNAVTQLARALGAKYAVSTTTSHAKAARAKELGFDAVVDLSEEGLADGVLRLTDGYGADIVIDAIGGEVLSEALGILAPGGSLTTLGYAGGRMSTIDVTHLIWKGASVRSFLLFTQPVSAWHDAWQVITDLLKAGKIKPIVAKSFPLEQAVEAMQYLTDDRPLGRVVLTI
jgi:NADPH2:quinone reductase